MTTLKEIIEQHISLNTDNGAYEAYKKFFAYEAKELGYTHIEHSDTHVIAFELDTDHPSYKGVNVIVIDGEQGDCPNEIYEIVSYANNSYIKLDN